MTWRRTTGENVLTRLAVFRGDRLHDARRDEFAAIGDRRHGGGHLQRRHPDFVAHRNPRDRNLAPGLRRPNHPADFTGQFDPGALAKSKAPDVFVEFLVADRDRQLRRADVARFHENVPHAQVPVGLVIVQRPSAKIPKAVLAKNGRVGPNLVLIQGRGGS